MSILRARQTEAAAQDDGSSNASDSTGTYVSPWYIERNRAAWDRWATDHIAAGRKAWNERELSWGVWGTPESELRLLENAPQSADIVELGSGTASISAWFARMGMHPVAVDFSRAQLEIAAGFQGEFGTTFSLVHANAEQVPFDQDSFDLAVSEYGASLWCEPHRWLREANRLLRPGGRLVFVANSAFLMVCTDRDGGPAGERLARDYFGIGAIEFRGEEVVEFHSTHGEWVRSLRDAGFVLEDLIEVRPPKGAKARFEFASADWARRWPSEEIWVARKSS